MRIFFNIMVDLVCFPSQGNDLYLELTDSSRNSPSKYIYIYMPISLLLLWFFMLMNTFQRWTTIWTNKGCFFVVLNTFDRKTISDYGSRHITFITDIRIVVFFKMPELLFLCCFKECKCGTHFMKPLDIFDQHFQHVSIRYYFFAHA